MRELLDVAYERMSTLPFDGIDVLLVASIGKDVSGQGMTTDVIGHRPVVINRSDGIRPVDGDFVPPSPE